MLPVAFLPITAGLRLEGNAIGDVGATELCRILRPNTTIAFLSLEGNRIGDAGAKELFELTHQTFGRGTWNLRLREIKYVQPLPFCLRFGWHLVSAVVVVAGVGGQLTDEALAALSAVRSRALPRCSVRGNKVSRKVRKAYQKRDEGAKEGECCVYLWK